MAITAWDVRRIGPQTWRGEAASDQVSPTFRYYLNGKLRGTTTRPWDEVTLLPGEVGRFEVFDDATAPAPGYPSRYTLRWEAVSGADRYRVDRWVDDEWVQVAIRAASGMLEYETDVLADCTEHLFRVVPVGANDGGAREVAVPMVRRPPAPVLVAAGTSYDAVTGEREIAVE